MDLKKELLKIRFDRQQTKAGKDALECKRQLADIVEEKTGCRDIVKEVCIEERNGKTQYHYKKHS